MVQILDQHGKPMMPSGKQRAMALMSGGYAPYDAADRMAPEVASWMPWLWAPDTETTPYRDFAVARIRDLVRNDGWASGTVSRLTDATVGADFRLSGVPDYRALQRRFGGAFDATWAKEFSDAAEAGWRSWAYDPGRYCDVERRMTFPQMARLAFRNYLVEGEAIAVIPWREERVGYGQARYATAVKMVDPDNLSNPQLRMDQLYFRGGVELDADGAPIAYHIRRAHMGAWWAAAQSVTWERFERETDWGRQVVVHHWDADRPGQHRPVGGIFAPILASLRMRSQYDRVELQAAVVNAIFGAYIESPYDAKSIEDALSDGDDEGRDRFIGYQQLRSEFHKERSLHAGNVRMPTLFPGEKITTVTAGRPSSAFDAFQATMLRNLATAVGAAYETVSSDYRGSSYSSARQASNEAWRTLIRRRTDFGYGFCTPVYCGLLEEMIDVGDVPLPAGAPDFADARAEYSRCRWTGPGRGYVEPTKEPEGSRLKISSGLSTLERETAENDGQDWEEVLDQRAIEMEAIKARGLEDQVIMDPTAAQAKPNAEPGENTPRPPQ